METKTDTLSLNQPSGTLALQHFNPGNIKTVDQARKAKASTLNALSRSYRVDGRNGNEEVIKGIAKWLIDLNKILDVKSPMSSGNILMCAQMIFDNYGYFKTTDLALFAQRIIQGEYGDLYESINITKIMRWAKQYAEERMSGASMESMMNHDKIVSRESDAPRISETR